MWQLGHKETGAVSKERFCLLVLMEKWRFPKYKPRNGKEIMIQLQDRILYFNRYIHVDVCTKY